MSHMFSEHGRAYINAAESNEAGLIKSFRSESTNLPVGVGARSFLSDSLDLLFVIVYAIMSFRTRDLPSRFPSLMNRANGLWNRVLAVPGIPGHSREAERQVGGGGGGTSSMREGSFCGIIRRKPQRQLSHRRSLALPLPGRLLHKESADVTLTWWERREATDVMRARACALIRHRFRPNR